MKILRKTHLRCRRCHSIRWRYDVVEMYNNDRLLRCMHCGMRVWSNNPNGTLISSDPLIEFKSQEKELEWCDEVMCELR